MEDIKALPQWSPSHTKKGKVKAPYFGIDKPSTHATYAQMQKVKATLGEESLFQGVMPTLEDPYVYLDVDVDPNEHDESGRKHSEVTPELLALLDKYPTYCERSPSGHGMHIIFKLTARAHETLKAKSITRISILSRYQPMTGELMFSSSFLIITEDSYFEEQSPIRTIGLEELLEFFPTLNKKLAAQPSNVIGINSRQRLTSAPDINDMRERLLKLPTEMNFYTERAYNNLVVPMQPNSYEHWVMVCMCLAHSALLSEDHMVHDEYYYLFDEWSQVDEASYVSQDDTAEKWEHCMSSTAQKMKADATYQPAVTKSTLHKLVNLCYPQYPNLSDKGAPLWEDTQNLETALAFHEMRFLADAYNFDSLYVECHKDVAGRVFNPTFGRHNTLNNKVMVHLKEPDLSFRKILEASAYHVPAISKCLKPVKALAVQEVDLDTNKNVHDKFQTFIDEKPWDGVPRVQDVINTLHFDKHSSEEVLNHYRTGLYKCLLWLTAIRYHGKPASAPAVPILVGGEGIYKSTWVKSLLHGTPFALQYTRPVSGLMSDRKELSRALQSTLVALVDEIETVLKSADKAKDILTEETLSLRAHYTNSHVNVMKRGVLFGTTNNPYMNASEDGNRRMFRITVQFCDTDALWKIDMQQVYAELKYDYEQFVKQGNHMPWVFTKAENALNNKIMGVASTASEDAILLHEFFGGAPQDFEFDPNELLGVNKGVKQNKDLVDQGYATTVRKITNEIVAYLQEQNFNVSVKPPNAAVIRRKLQSFSAKYTKSEHKTILIGKHSLLNGMLVLKKQTLFIVPQRRKES